MYPALIFDCDYTNHVNRYMQRALLITCEAREIRESSDMFRIQLKSSYLKVVKCDGCALLVSDDFSERKVFQNILLHFK